MQEGLVHMCPVLELQNFQGQDCSFCFPYHCHDVVSLRMGVKDCPWGIAQVQVSVLVWNYRIFEGRIGVFVSLISAMT